MGMAVYIAIAIPRGC